MSIKKYEFKEFSDEDFRQAVFGILKNIEEKNSKQKQEEMTDKAINDLVSTQGNLINKLYDFVKKNKRIKEIDNIQISKELLEEITKVIERANIYLDLIIES